MAKRKTSRQVAMEKTLDRGANFKGVNFGRCWFDEDHMLCVCTGYYGVRLTSYIDSEVPIFGPNRTKTMPNLKQFTTPPIRTACTHLTVPKTSDLRKLIKDQKKMKRISGDKNPKAYYDFPGIRLRVNAEALLDILYLMGREGTTMTWYGGLNQIYFYNMDNGNEGFLFPVRITE